MRLWHQKMIKYLPRQQLLGQHRECCALRGNGWGKKHSVVDYVFTYTPERLVAYHALIINEMRRRGYKPDLIWENRNWRGKTLQEQKDWCNYNKCMYYFDLTACGEMIYPEHNDEYLQECIDNLKSKGIEIEVI